MEAYAVIETGGKQYKVEAGDVLIVERLEAEVGASIQLDKVLAQSDGKTLSLGAPILDGASLEATVVEHLRGKKIYSFKKKRRKGYKRKIGHRQDLTRLQIGNFGAESAKKKPAKKKAEVENTEEAA